MDVAAGRQAVSRLPKNVRRLITVPVAPLAIRPTGAATTEIEEFITGLGSGSQHAETVRAILLTDIEGSTALARDLGDERWADLLERYDRIAGIAVAAHGDPA